MDRRAFLSIVAGSPLVFGLRELLAQEAAPEFIDAALKRMKETRRYGVFLVIPEADAARKILGQGLVDRIPTGSKAGNTGFELFCAHVFTCLSSDQAAKRGWGAKVGANVPVLRLLVDPQGKQVAADRVALDVFEDASKFNESFGAFIHGADSARLRDHAMEIEKSLPEDITKAIEVISRPPRQVETEAANIEFRKAMDLVKGRIDSIAPWLVHLSFTKENEKTFLQRRVRQVLWEHYLEQSAKSPDPVLPFGIKVERIVVEDPCPPCGMAAYRPTSYRFISFYSK